MGFIEAWGAFESQKPDLRIKELVKNKDLQRPIDAGIGKLMDTYNVSEEGVSNLKGLFSKDAPLFQKYADEAVSRIDNIMNGQLEGQLGRLRQSQYDARMGATERAIDRVNAQANSQRARMGISGGNTYLDLNNLRAVREAMIPAELERAAMERADADYLRNIQLANAGTRSAILQQQEQQQMMPAQLISALRGVPLANISGYQQLDDANKIRALWREKSMVERAGDWDAKNVEAIGQLIGMISGIGGMGGGPKPSAPNPRNAPAQTVSYQPAYGGYGMQYNTGSGYAGYGGGGFQGYGGYGGSNAPQQMPGGYGAELGGVGW